MQSIFTGLSIFCILRLTAVLRYEILHAMSKTDLAGRRLRALLAQHGTQQEAASALGISQQYLSDLLLGRRTFSEAMLAKLGLRRTVVEARS